MAGRAQLPSNISDIVNFVRKINKREAESIILLIFILWGCSNCRWLTGGRVGQKVPTLEWGSQLK